MPEPDRIDFNELQFPQQQRIDFNEIPTAKYNDMTLGQKAMNDLSMMGVAAESAGRGYFDNLMNVPNAIGEVVGNALAYPHAAIRSIGTGIGERAARFNMATGEPLSPYGGWQANLEMAKNTWPASALIGGYDAPTSFDAQALVSAAPMAAYQYRTPEEYGPMREPDRELTDIGEQYKQYRDNALEGYLQRREAQPIGAAGGDIAADVATVISGRAPAVSALRTRRLAAPPTKPVHIEPGFRRFLERKANDVRGWARTSGVRLAETGVEGAFLAALQDEDPAAGAAFGVGMQAVGNITDSVWKHFPGKTPSMKIAYGAIGTTAIIQLLKSLTPGGRDRILESEESAFNKLAGLVAIGALSHAAGFSRPSRMIQDDLGAIVDTWHSARRGAVMSVFSEIQNDDSGDLDLLTNKIFQDPTYFDETAMRRISRAMIDENVSLNNTIETLMESDRKFRRKLLALREQ